MAYSGYYFFECDVREISMIEDFVSIEDYDFIENYDSIEDHDSIVERVNGGGCRVARGSTVDSRNTSLTTLSLLVKLHGCTVIHRDRQCIQYPFMC